MTKKTKGRDRLHGGATPITSNNRNHNQKKCSGGWVNPAKLREFFGQQQHGQQE